MKKKKMKIEKEDKSEYENCICCPFLKSTKCN